MDTLPSELILHICNFNTYKTNIVFKSICKHKYKIINAEQILYDNHNHKIQNTELYSQHEIGNFWIEPNDKEKFILPEDEHVLYQLHRECSDIKFILVTINKYRNFIVRCFFSQGKRKKSRLYTTEKYTYLKYVDHISCSSQKTSENIVKNIKNKILYIN